jgi:hypothetical protein
MIEPRLYLGGVLCLTNRKGTNWSARTGFGLQRRKLKFPMRCHQLSDKSSMDVRSR